jgi:hypothetical protein
MSIPGATFRPLPSEARSTIDVVTRTELKNPAAKTLLGMVQEEFERVAPPLEICYRLAILARH